MPDNSSTIAENLKKVRNLIETCSKNAGRNENDIDLLAVSKTKPVSDIVLAYNFGQRNFGENYVQEGVDKIAELKAYQGIIWHFIGPLQSNKSRLVAENFDWMHSLDRLKIAKRLNEQRPVFKAPLNCCIQVNVDEEESKAGALPHEVIELIASMQDFQKIKIRGLMAIPKASDDKAMQRESFEKMRLLFEQCKQKFSDFDTLSIGMSGDIDVAIECGSTMVRVGTAIFGQRVKANS